MPSGTKKTSTSKATRGKRHAKGGYAKKVINEVLNEIVARSGDLPPLLWGQAYKTWIEESSTGLVIRREIVQLSDPSSTPVSVGAGSKVPPK
jgi:hypothetical protein